MAGQPDTFTSPIGRLVQGDAFEFQTKDQQGNLRVIKTGPNAGKPAPIIYMGVAFPKVTPDGRPNQEWEGFWAQMNRIARRDWPHLFDANGVCTARSFAWKVIDGDGVDDKNKPYSEREGFAGCWIVRFSSSFAPKVFHANRYGAADQVQDKNALRRGYYVRIAGTMVGNDNQQNPGLYMNASLVEIAGYGPEIMGGADPNAAFGGTSSSAPSGMSATPLGSNTAPPGPGLGANAPPPPAAAPATPPTPPAAPPASSGPRMLPAAGATTYEAYKAAGWTDDQLVAAGYMAAPVSAPPPAPSAPPPAPSAPPPAPATPPPPPAASTPPPPPAAPVRQMLPAAGATTYEAYLAAGWTDAQLIAAGYMAP